MSVRTVITMKTERNRCWRGCGETGAPAHCWWEFKMQKSGAVPPKWNTELPYYPAVLLTGMYPRRTESREPPRCYTPVPTSRIPSSQTLKTNQMPAHWHVNTYTECGVYAQRSIITRSSKARTFWRMLQHGWSLRTFCSVDKASHKRTNIVRFCLYEVHSVGTVDGGRKEKRLRRGRRAGRSASYCLMGAELLLGKMRKFWKWMVAMVAQHCEGT